MPWGPALRVTFVWGLLSHKLSLCTVGAPVVVGRDLLRRPEASVAGRAVVQCIVYISLIALALGSGGLSRHARRRHADPGERALPPPPNCSVAVAAYLSAGSEQQRAVLFVVPRTCSKAITSWARQGSCGAHGPATDPAAAEEPRALTVDRHVTCCTCRTTTTGGRVFCFLSSVVRWLSVAKCSPATSGLSQVGLERGQIAKSAGDRGVGLLLQSAARPLPPARYRPRRGK